MARIDEIRIAIERRLDDLMIEAAALEAARTALLARDEGTGERTAPKRRPRRAAAVTPIEPLSVEQLEEQLNGSEGASAVAIAKRTGASYERVRAMLERLQAAGRVRSTGHSRTSLWRLLSDEERIAARVAELEAQLASRGRRGASARREAVSEPENSGTDSASAGGRSARAG
jgi:hypothetical protein